MYLLHELIHVAQDIAEDHPIDFPVEEPDPEKRSTPDITTEEGRETEWNNQMHDLAGKILADQEAKHEDVPWNRMPDD